MQKKLKKFDFSEGDKFCVKIFVNRFLCRYFRPLLQERRLSQKHIIFIEATLLDLRC